MKLSIGIISYNTKEMLGDCLKSIADQGGDYLANTTVIDNASNDGSQQLVKDGFSTVKLIENKENQGFAKAANQAIKKSDGDMVVVLNTDTVLHENSLENLIDFMKSCPQAGAVGPLLLNPDGSNQASGRRVPSFFDASIHAFLGVVAPNNRYTRRYKLLDWDRNNKREVDWISGAAICLRKKAAQDVGLFDERYFMYVEDMDLCYRLWENGWKVFLLPEAKVTHHIGQSSKQFNNQMIKEFEKSIFRFFKKQNKDSLKRYLSPLIWLGLKLRTRLLILNGRLRKGSA
ncbi:MAG TPA: glycosyltransferase family 2 protein [Actinobacteria bacterium]|nr:glycosyltransferase family 2 protein [Actinomycetota bacterium]